MAVGLVGRYLFLGIILIVCPQFVGSLLDGIFYVGESVAGRLLLRWSGGQMLFWAGFQFFCVPWILLGRPFSEVVWLANGYWGLLFLLAAGKYFYLRYGRHHALHLVGAERVSNAKPEKRVLLLWLVFAVLLLFQLVQALRLTYADWDDAFYVATSTVTEQANSMYQVLPYTGGATGLDARHGLAPFPVWIAYLSRISGVHAATVAHMVVPVVLISMTYGIYALLGICLFRSASDRTEKLPLFMIFTELLVLFGNYSIYSPENFMIARSRQGKAALGNIVVPMLVLLLLALLDKLQQNRKISRRYWILLLAVMLASCLCSTMGAALAAFFVGTAAVITAICYRKVKYPVGLCCCCLPCGVYLLLYLVLR